MKVIEDYQGRIIKRWFGFRVYYTRCLQCSTQRLIGVGVGSRLLCWYSITEHRGGFCVLGKITETETGSEGDPAKRSLEVKVLWGKPPKDSRKILGFNIVRIPSPSLQVVDLTRRRATAIVPDREGHTEQQWYGGNTFHLGLRSLAGKTLTIELPKTEALKVHQLMLELRKATDEGVSDEVTEEFRSAGKLDHTTGGSRMS